MTHDSIEDDDFVIRKDRLPKAKSDRQIDISIISSPDNMLTTKAMDSLCTSAR